MQHFAAQPGFCGCISLVPLFDALWNGCVRRFSVRTLFERAMDLLSYLRLPVGSLSICLSAVVTFAYVFFSRASPFGTCFLELFGSCRAFCSCSYATSEIADSLAPAAIRSCSARLMAHVIQSQSRGGWRVRGQLHALTGRIQSVAGWCVPGS